MSFIETQFKQAYAAPLKGILRSKPEDFIVEEQCHIQPSGQGEHLWLQVRKTGANTDWVAGQLAQIAGIPKKDVGFAGLKDRHAVTTQWFSLQLAGKADPDFSNDLPEGVEILQAIRHDKKLKRGALTGNRFVLTLRDVQGDMAQAQTIIEQIKQQGIPNYFGEQRFGHDRNNLNRAQDWFEGKFRPKSRNLKSLCLSAARSWLFNHILSKRIEQGTWNQRMAGDVFMLEGSHSCFADDGSDELTQRLQEQDIHPTGAAWGRGSLTSQADVLTLETEVVEPFSAFCQGLEKNGLQQERRALRIKLSDITLESLESDVIRLSFELPAGAYATVVLAQLGEFTEPDFREA